ncbi:MAG: c-type cytochrome [Nostocaceae cyanobacterium]|nr:c-type cytochrome [Nostocaceae cyanobacterium]
MWLFNGSCLTYNQRELNHFLIKFIKIILITLIICNLNLIPTALAANPANGAKIFTVHCAGCHINGGNIVRRGKNLKMRALKKYGMDSQDAIVNIVANGKNNMSAYKDRLTEAEIQAVAKYVLEQAAKGWR